ncbi:hypothetical protein ABTD76_09125 [Acinetobacter baumannii]
MELKKLDASFYVDNPVVIQALEFDIASNTWMGTSKTRGHGVVQIEINSLVFAIPVRSNISHNASFILEKNKDKSRPKIKGMGLDYSKALLIRDNSHVSNNLFLLSSKTAGKKLQGKHQHITTSFQKYVHKYVDAVQKKDSNILNQMEYRFTTLINYHIELSLTQV